MHIKENIPPRVFDAGYEIKRRLSHCATISLSADELVTFVTDSGGEFDVTRKEWGFYATPSINKRLVSFGFLTAIVKNRDGHLFVLLVEKGKILEFKKYISEEKAEVLQWLGQEE